MQPMRHRPNQLICNINVAAFASVMLALLYLFMSPGVDEYRGSAIDLAKVSAPVPMRAAGREDAMVIGIRVDGRIFFRSDRVSIDELPDRIRESIRQGSEKKVYIKADFRAKYLWVSEVLDNVRTAGVEKIAFLVDQRQTPASNPQ
jgi:biopolymer transport protein ExbD/biopolymer transport protein TolR